MRVPILTYHLVRDDLAASNLVISKKKLEEQISYLLSSGYVSISLQDLLDWNEAGKSLPARPVILTFDDGFLDCYQNAWPLLAKYGARFTVFLVSGQIGNANNWAGIRRGELRLLDRSQILEMHAAGVSFGAHSCTHPSLIRLADAELKEEVRKCRQQLSEIIGIDPRFFAYPYGEFNTRVRNEVKASGYSGACTTLHGFNDDQTDLFQLRRLQISGTDSLTDFRFKLKFGFGLLSYSNFKSAANHLFREKKILRAYETTRTIRHDDTE